MPDNVNENKLIFRINVRISQETRDFIEKNGNNPSKFLRELILKEMGNV